MPIAPAVKVPAAAPIVTPRFEPSVEAQAEIAQLAAPVAAAAARTFAAPIQEEFEPEPEETSSLGDTFGGKPMWFWVATVAGIWFLAMIFWLIFLPAFRGPDYELRKKQLKQQNQKSSQPANPKAADADNPATK
jgi:hypothetical protein